VETVSQLHYDDDTDRHCRYSCSCGALDFLGGFKMNNSTTQEKCLSCPYYLGVVKCAVSPCQKCLTFSLHPDMAADEGESSSLSENYSSEK